MTRFILKRLLMIIPTLLVVSLLIFALLRFVPGDPAALIVGDLGDTARVAEVRSEMGLDQPLPIQYVIWLSRVVTGDFGLSFMTSQPVLQDLIDRFLVTLQLVLPAFFLSIILAIPAGLWAAARANSRTDLSINGFATILMSVPSFWVGMMLILYFGTVLGWLPTLGFVEVTENPVEWFRHIILPTTALVAVELGVLTRLVRANALDILAEDYVDFALSRGLSWPQVVWRHVLKNAVALTLPLIGLILSSLLSGAAIIETLFGIPGLGRFLVDAIYARDYPVIQGVLLFVVLIYALVNVVVDILHSLLDPRVRLA